ETRVLWVPLINHFVNVQVIRFGGFGSIVHAGFVALKGPLALPIIPTVSKSNRPVPDGGLPHVQVWPHTNSLTGPFARGTTCPQIPKAKSVVFGPVAAIIPP